MARNDLSEEKQKEYDRIVETIMKEIAEQNPEQYHVHTPGVYQLDGKASQIYRDTFEKYRSELERILLEGADKED